jgi:hypothetical protein
VADPDKRDARRGHAAHVVARSVDLELDEQLRDLEAELRAVEQRGAAAPVADRPHVRAALAELAEHRERA